MPPGARVGTSSLRRESQLRAWRPDLAIEPLRGNVQTRLRKLDEGQYDAILLAAAGLKRLGLAERIRALLAAGAEPARRRAGRARDRVPRRHATTCCALLAPLDHAPTAAAVRAERAVVAHARGSLQRAARGVCEVTGGRLRLRAYVGSPDGNTHVRGSREGAVCDAEAIGVALAHELRESGAEAILADLAAESR